MILVAIDQPGVHVQMNDNASNFSAHHTVSAGGNAVHHSNAADAAQTLALQMFLLLRSRPSVAVSA